MSHSTNFERIDPETINQRYRKHKTLEYFLQRIHMLRDLIMESPEGNQLDIEQHIIGDSLCHEQRLERRAVGPMQCSVQQIRAARARWRQNSLKSQLAQERHQCHSRPIRAAQLPLQTDRCALKNVLQGQLAGAQHIRLDIQLPKLGEHTDVVQQQTMAFGDQSLHILLQLESLDGSSQLCQLLVRSSESGLRSLVSSALSGESYLCGLVLLFLIAKRLLQLDKSLGILRQLCLDIRIFLGDLLKLLLDEPAVSKLSMKLPHESFKLGLKEDWRWRCASVVSCFRVCFLSRWGWDQGEGETIRRRKTED
eukprot:m.289871 g.289871  ORF g.289871 m.289871 type:complete len:309 (-) comp55064_c0_seq19:73-999(-)